MNNYLGQFAALFTSVCWSVSSVFFTRSGQLVGSVIVNRIRLVIAVIYLILAHLILGLPMFANIEPYRWYWLSLSGVLGLVIGDAFLFQAFVMIGPRLSMLMMSLAPIIASVFGVFLLSERLTFWQVVGILITISGVSVVILEKNGNLHLESNAFRYYLVGILFGLGGATGQAVGLITAKKGLTGTFPALTGTLIRMLAATIAMWFLTLLIGKVRITFLAISQNPKSIFFILIGAFAGPLLGVTASLIAIQNSPVGIASALMALPPVFLLPVSYFFFKERFGWIAVLGTFLAVSGVAILFLV